MNDNCRKQVDSNHGREVMQSSKIELGTPSPLFEAAARNRNGRWYDVGPDGRFLLNMAPPASQAQNFELVVNWPAELKH